MLMASDALAFRMCQENQNRSTAGDGIYVALTNGRFGGRVRATGRVQ
jgi:hypothetical protein